MTNSTATAIARCHKAYRDAYDKYIAANGSETISRSFARGSGKEAYRLALPQLSSRQAALDFIACVADGILTESISEKTSTKLLYAAQVALNGFPRDEHKPQKSKK